MALTRALVSIKALALWVGNASTLSSSPIVSDSSGRMVISPYRMPGASYSGRKRDLTVTPGSIPTPGKSWVRYWSSNCWADARLGMAQTDTATSAAANRPAPMPPLLSWRDPIPMPSPRAPNYHSDAVLRMAIQTAEAAGTPYPAPLGRVSRPLLPK